MGMALPSAIRTVNLQKTLVLAIHLTTDPTVHTVLTRWNTSVINCRCVLWVKKVLKQCAIGQFLVVYGNFLDKR